jgi:uncharacterized membrane-anchored protein YitT (DUF2179 family)
MSALRAEPRPVGGIPHSRVEDLLGLATGAVVVSLGLYLLNAVHAVTGGTAGLSLLLSYAADVPFEVLFVAVNIPFFLLAIAQKGVRFTLRSLACVVCVSLLATMHARLVDLTAIERVYGVALGNLLAGIGLLILFRHGASLGGFTIVALLLQERVGLRAGYVQMLLDVCVVLGSFFVVDARTMVLSALGAVILNIVLAFNHRPGRYTGY